MTFRRRAPGERQTEICVLGGGPAGAVVARRLAKLGYDVLLVERETAKRRERAESLAPSILPILDSLGLRNCAEQAAFQREERTLVDWEPGGPNVRSYEGLRPLLVDRARFDKLLRKAAYDAGADLIAPATAQAPRHLGAGAWAVPITASDEPIVIRAAFLVDARGRRRGGNVYGGTNGFRTAALSGTWEIGEADLVETRIEAGIDEWLWGTPLPNHLYAATIFLESERLAGLSGDDRNRLYRHILMRSPLLQRAAQGRMIGPANVCDATSRTASSLIEADFIRVGEAAFSIDPLSSQGVQAAIVSAIQGSAAVHTLLSNQIDLPLALEFYRERQKAAAARSALAASRVYRLRAGEGASPFWLCRSLGEGPTSAERRPRESISAPLPSELCLSHELQIVEIPVLCGALIRRVPALHHPGLASPIAYLAGVEVAPLVIEVMKVSDRHRILEQWARRLHPGTCREIMNWMYRAGIIIRQLP
jgi:flavin-dependent dehydrogenase